MKLLFFLKSLLIFYFCTEVSLAKRLNMVRVRNFELVPGRIRIRNK
jgi:hypothetical protein